ncbi:MAG: hypothetical protein JW786_01500 [Desulfobacterales bacterium]|nr:hypothetical protein [Desulfobacterales bacterium]
MKYNPEIHRRRSIRLKGYDYSRAGFYFITICTQNRLCLFGKIDNGGMNLNDAGRIVEKCLSAIPDHYPHAKLRECIIMPNHVHFIVEITVGANNYSPLHSSSIPIHGTSKTIGSIVRGFKIGVTKWFREKTDIYTVWQRNYYEHIIRGEQSYLKLSKYIINNPKLWQNDQYYE